MNQLEPLLNSLIKMGWKPWGKDVDKITMPLKEEFDEDRCLFIDIKFSNGFGTYRPRRELVSLESGLWQFVCENELVPYQTSGQIIKRYVNETVGRYSGNILEGEVISSDLDYEYRLLESALVPEEELEKFLVDNIKH